MRAIRKKSSYFCDISIQQKNSLSHQCFYFSVFDSGKLDDESNRPISYQFSKMDHANERMNGAPSSSSSGFDENFLQVFRLFYFTIYYVCFLLLIIIFYSFIFICCFKTSILQKKGNKLKIMKLLIHQKNLFNKFLSFCRTVL